jgi:hypothetical protein
VNILGIAVKVPAVVELSGSTDVVAIVKEVDGRTALRGEDGIESPLREELRVSRLAPWLICVAAKVKRLRTSKSESPRSPAMS